MPASGPPEGSAEESELLRLENAALRERLAALETALQRVEETATTSPRVETEDDAEASELRTLLAEADQKKQEALRYAGVGKNKLAKQVKQLYALLQKAKVERQELLDTIAGLREDVEQEQREKGELERKFELDRIIFKQVIKEDRAAYASRLHEAEDALDEKERERQEALRWVQERQHGFQVEIQVLQEQLIAARKETTMQALQRNDGLARDLEQLEAEVAAYARAEDAEAAAVEAADDSSVRPGSGSGSGAPVGSAPADAEA